MPQVPVASCSTDPVNNRSSSSQEVFLWRVCTDRHHPSILHHRLSDTSGRIIEGEEPGGRQRGVNSPCKVPRDIDIGTGAYRPDMQLFPRIDVAEKQGMNGARERRGGPLVNRVLGRMDQERQTGNGGPYQALLNMGDYGSGTETQPYVGLYDRRLPCCGCGIGWCSFLMGFFLPLFWYYGTFLFFAAQYQNDPRERPGLAACAIAALVNTVALVIALMVLLIQRKGLTGFNFFTDA